MQRAGECRQKDDRRRDGDARAIVRIGREPESNGRLIYLVTPRVKLRQARRFADYERQNAGSDRIERSQMTYFFRSGQPPHPVHDVVRGQPSGLIEDEDAVHKDLQSDNL